MGGSSSKECSEDMCISVLKKNEDGELEEHYIPASKLEQNGDIKAQIEEIVANSREKVDDFLASSQTRVDDTMSTIEGVSVNNLSVMNLSEFSVIPEEFRDLYLEVAQILIPFFKREVNSAISEICDGDVEGCLLQFVSTSSKTEIIDSIKKAIQVYDSTISSESKQYIIDSIKKRIVDGKQYRINITDKINGTSERVLNDAEIGITKERKERDQVETFTSKMGKDIKYDKLILCILLAYLLLKIVK